MTNEELLAAIEHRFDRIDGRFEQFDGRFEQIDVRFEQIDVRFDQIDVQFEQIDFRFKQVDVRFEQIDVRFKEVQEHIHKLGVELEDVRDNMIGALGDGVDQVRRDLRAFQAKTDSRFDRVDERLDALGAARH